MSGSRTARNIAIVSGASFLQIVIQFLFQRALALVFGAGQENDALVAALALPTLFAAMITGWLSYVLVPELTAGFSQTDNDAERSAGRPVAHSAWELAAFVGLLTTALGLLVSVLLAGDAERITAWLYGDMPPAQQQATAQILRILSVQVVLSGLISWAQAVHHSRHSFIVPAVGGVLGTGLSLCWAYRFGSSGIVQIAWAINLGSLLSVAIHAVPLFPHLRRPVADTQRLWRLLRLTWPLLLGAAIMRLDPLVDRVLAAKLDAGAQSHVYFAQRIITALLAIGTSGLSIIAFPQLAQRLSDEGHAGFSQHFALAFRRLVLIVVPISIGVSVFAVWIVRDLLEGGQFTTQDSITVGWLSVGFMGMLIGASTGELLSRAYFVLGDTRTPTFLGISALLAGWVVKVTLFEFVGIWGIAGGVSFYFLLSAGSMAWVLASKTSWEIFSGSGRQFLQALLASAVACGASYLIYAGKLGGTFVAAPVGGGAYFLSLLLMRNRDSWQLWTVVKLRILSRVS